MNKAGGWLSLAGVIISLFGFGLGWRQLRRTAKASETANKTLADVIRHFNTNFIRVMLPEVIQIVTDLNQTMTEENKSATINHLRQFTHKCSQLVSLLEQNQKDIAKNTVDSQKAKGFFKFFKKKEVRSENSEDGNEIISVLKYASDAASKSKGNLFRDKEEKMTVSQHLSKTIDIIEDASNKISGLTAIIQFRMD